MQASEANILLVDGDLKVTQVLHNYLSNEGYQVSVANSGEEGVQMMCTKSYDLFLLAVILPKIDGFEVLKRIRISHVTPVILLTSKDEEFECIYGLELGADDYIPKPLNSKELLARVRARLRREVYRTQSMLKPVLMAGDLRIETHLRKATYKDKMIVLTDAEFAIVELLTINQGQVVSKKDISAQAFKRPLLEFDRSIDMHMSNLRKKFCVLNAYGLIRTIRSRGYMLVQQCD